MKHLILGTAYYIEYALTDRLERDLALMQEAGINTIRIAESTWSVEELRCGEFDFSCVTRVIEAAARHGISVIVGTPTYAIPRWLDLLDPTILDGSAFGTRQNMDITNPTYRFYAERIIRELVSHTAGYPNVIGFQIDNETKHYGVNNARVRTGFRDWLKRRFGTIEAVNRAYLLNHWSLSVASFDDLPDPAASSNGGYLCAFEEYRRELAAEFLHWQSAIVREYKREDQFITHNFDYDWKELGLPGEQNGCSVGLQPDRNDFEAARAVTLAGTDVYTPPCDSLTGRELAYAGDLMRPLKRAPYLVLESQSQAFAGWLPYPGQLRLMALMHLASGACGLEYWSWTSLHGGKETYWKGILSHDGEPGETYLEICQIGGLYRKLSPLLEDKPQSRIALIVSPEALHALRQYPTDRELPYNEIVNAYHRALYELNLECDILYDREPDWSGYDLLIFPALYCASDAVIERVRGFAAKGGSVFASFRSFFADENVRVRGDSQPHGLTDVFGLRYDRFTKNRRHRWMELLEPDGAETLRRYDDPHWGAYAALTHHRFGSGHAWYLGCDTAPAELRVALLRAAEAAGISAPSLRFPLVCKRRGNLRFLLNFSDETQQIQSPVTGRELLAERTVQAGDTLSLAPWGAAVIQVEST